MRRKEGGLLKTLSNNRNHSSLVRTSEKRVARSGHAYTCVQYTKSRDENTQTVCKDSHVTQNFTNLSSDAVTHEVTEKVFVVKGE